MLREYQEEIARLREQLEATQRGVIIGEDGKVRIMTTFYLAYAYILTLKIVYGIYVCRK